MHEKDLLLAWADAHGLGESELAVVKKWGGYTAGHIGELRGTPMETLFPRHRYWWVAAIHDFFGLGPTGQVSAEMRTRIFEAINYPPKRKGKKDEL